jgi:hypothetical protein
MVRNFGGDWIEKRGERSAGYGFTEKRILYKPHIDYSTGHYNRPFLLHIITVHNCIVHYYIMHTHYCKSLLLLHIITVHCTLYIMHTRYCTS